MSLKVAGGLEGLGSFEGCFQYLTAFAVSVLWVSPWISCKRSRRRHLKEDYMKRYSNIVAPDLVRRLVATGFLPVDAQDAAITQPAPPGLHIDQVGGLVESSIFDLKCGSGTGCILPLYIAVDLNIFSIWRWELDLPWKDPKFQFLPEPQGHRFPDNMYKFPGCENLMYPRDQVINHQRELKPGRILEGLLLGFSFESIPDSYHHRSTIHARLVLIDGKEHSFSTPIQLWADRSVKFDRQRSKKNTKKRAFEKLDEGEGAIVETRIL